MNYWNQPSQPINKCKYIQQFDLQVLKHLFDSAIYIFIANVFIYGNMQFELQTIEDLFLLVQLWCDLPLGYGRE